MKKFSSAFFSALAISLTVGSLPSFANGLLLQKTVVLQGSPGKTAPGDTGVTPNFALDCDVGIGKCVYEAVATIQMGANTASGNQVGAYLSIDGSAPTCMLSGNMPNDGSFFTRTEVVAVSAVARGPHKVQLRICPNAGGFTLNAYTATFHVYTAR
jgi:hypothetical protein